ACYGIKIDHTERETTGVVGKAERLTWHKAWTMVSTGFSISYTSSITGSGNPGDSAIRYRRLNGGDCA
ncbi:hypothetical protein PVV10_18675, partial [Salmonella enterica subsp. enterica serovar Typhimurium]|uniref:hypothetical protein n=1 Tax=Salmonella enterica TaxID=28901 RepID=UPI002FFAB1B6